MGICVKGDIYRYDLKFKEPAMTSRGTYYTHTIWYVTLLVDNQLLIGECAPLPDLSSDFLGLGNSFEERLTDYEAKLKELFSPIFTQYCQCHELSELLALKFDTKDFLNYPSMLFGLETLQAQLQHQLASYNPEFTTGSCTQAKINCQLTLWDSAFARNEQGIAINGLIWMGDFNSMEQRIKDKLTQGFRCIKLKIGAIDFDQELALLSFLRERFSPEELELRVDANGAFSFEDAPYKLEQLSKFHLHSIEQPIKARQYQHMAELCNNCPIAIGLDEELIGVYDSDAKIELIDTIKPQYLVIKPSLHGGFAGTKEWIKLAQERHIGYWLTSALESTIGLNALAQWCATTKLTMPQGLGTGALYTNNLNTPMYIANAQLHCNLGLEQMQDYGTYLTTLLNQEAVHLHSIASA